MSPAEIATVSKTGRKVNWLVSVAFALGFIAVAMAAFERNFIAPPQPQPGTKKEGVWEAAKSLLSKKLSREKEAAVGTKAKHPYQLTYIGIGLVAVGLGAFGWARFSHSRLAAAAVALGLIAIAWEWAVVGIGIAVAIFILGSLG